MKPETRALAPLTCQSRLSHLWAGVGGHEKLPSDGHESARWRS
jgi:hypothetical protein